MWSLPKLLNLLLLALRDNTEALGYGVGFVGRQNKLLQRSNELTISNNSLVLDLNIKIQKLLDRLRNLPDPGQISLSVTSENGTMLTFKIKLPPLPDDPGDIVSGELTIAVGAGEQQVIATTKEQTEVVGLTGQQGEQVNASYAFVDDAGNRSAHPSAIAGLVLSDTIPPADPGALALEVTGESS